MYSWVAGHLDAWIGITAAVDDVDQTKVQNHVHGNFCALCWILKFVASYCCPSQVSTMAAENFARGLCLLPYFTIDAAV